MIQKLLSMAWPSWMPVAIERCVPLVFLLLLLLGLCLCDLVLNDFCLLLFDCPFRGLGVWGLGFKGYFVLLVLVGLRLFACRCLLAILFIIALGLLLDGDDLTGNGMFRNLSSLETTHDHVGLLFALGAHICGLALLLPRVGSNFAIDFFLVHISFK